MTLEKIVDIFNKNIRNKCIVLKNFNTKHDGKIGHWLEKQFGITHNSSNSPDIYGFELKKESNKITFGDWSATVYIFSNKNIPENYSSNSIKNREMFIKTFGTEKNGRFSWSGKCISGQYNFYNEYGQGLTIDKNNNIKIFYSYRRDRRENKKDIIPLDIKEKNRVILAIWTEEKIKKHVDTKFKCNGFFICKMENGVFTTICFGPPFDYLFFLENIKLGNIIFDSGMYEGNKRNYSHWRAKKTFWNDLLISTY